MQFEAWRKKFKGPISILKAGNSSKSLSSQLWQKNTNRRTTVQAGLDKK
jgi:hypothetical protein